MNQPANKFCTACTTEVAQTMRICPNCGGKVFSAQRHASAPPAAAQRTNPPQPTPAVHQKPLLPPVRTSRLRAAIPLTQARLLGGPLVALVILAVVVTFGLLWAGSGVVADQVAESMSPEQQRQITLNHSEYSQAMAHALPANHILSQVVTIIGTRLSTAIRPKSEYEYHFHVIDSDDINAFAMPGGEIFVLTGLLKQFPDEGQIAAVLAHEIQHVEQRHSTKHLYRAVGGAALWGLALGIFTDQSAISAIKLSSLKYGRSNETEADLLGAKLMESAGYPRKAMVDMLNGLAAKEGKSLPAWLSSHPDTEERAKRVQRGV